MRFEHHGEYYILCFMYGCKKLVICCFFSQLAMQELQFVVEHFDTSVLRLTYNQSQL